MEEREMKDIELLRGTELEIEREYHCRISQGYDGRVAQDLYTGEWVLNGTPVDWYLEHEDQT